MGSSMHAAYLSFIGPLFIAVGPGVKHWNEERLNWPTHYRREYLTILGFVQLNII